VNVRPVVTSSKRPACKTGGRSPRCRANLRAVDPRRLSRGEWVAAAAAVLMLVALFLPWYSVGGKHVTAWQSMAVDDVLLALIAVGTLVADLATASRRRAAVPVAYTTMATLGGLVALILTVVRLADPAPSGHAGLAIGAWIGLVAALGLAGGASAGMRDEGPARRRESLGRSAAAAALEHAELVSLPPDVGQPTPAGGDHA